MTCGTIQQRRFTLGSKVLVQYVESRSRRPPSDDDDDDNDGDGEENEEEQQQEVEKEEEQEKEVVEAEHAEAESKSFDTTISLKQTPCNTSRDSVLPESLNMKFEPSTVIMPELEGIFTITSDLQILSGKMDHPLESPLSEPPSADLI